MKKKIRAPIMDGELIPVGTIEGGLEKFNDEAFEIATKAGDWLPRLQLMTSSSDKCKGGEFPINHYALVRSKDFQDLGDAVDVLVVTWRPKALEIGENVLAVYDPKSTEFIRIQEKSAGKDSGCMYGPEFLIYIPSVGQWATFFMGSKSARNEAGAMRARLHKAATLKAQKLANKSYTWYSTQVNPCTTPFELPPVEEIQEQANKFNNPPATEIEVDEAEDTRER